MHKVYEYQNGTIYVTLPTTCDRKLLKQATEEFLKKVISEEKKHGNINTTRDIREK